MFGGMFVNLLAKHSELDEWKLQQQSENQRRMEI